MKIEKNNCKGLHSRSKWTEIKHVLFRDFGCKFPVAVKNDSELKVPFH